MQIIKKELRLTRTAVVDIATKLTQWKAELISVIILNELQQFYTLTISLMNNYWLLIDY